MSQQPENHRHKYIVTCLVLSCTSHNSPSSDSSKVLFDCSIQIHFCYCLLYNCMALVFLNINNHRVVCWPYYFSLQRRNASTTRNSRKYESSRWCRNRRKGNSYGRHVWFVFVVWQKHSGFPCNRDPLWQTICVLFFETGVLWLLLCNGIQSINNVLYSHTMYLTWLNYPMLTLW